MQLQQEVAAAQARAQQEAAKYEERTRQLLEQEQQRLEDLQQRQEADKALAAALDACADCELRNAILEELVQQLEIAVRRLEGEKGAAAERYASLRAVMGAVEARAAQAEQQHAQLLQRISVELAHHD